MSRAPLTADAVSGWLLAALVFCAAMYFVGATMNAAECAKRGGVYVLRLPLPLGVCVQPMPTPEPRP